MQKKISEVKAGLFGFASVALFFGSVWCLRAVWLGFVVRFNMVCRALQCS